jgi:hypothetical protein
MAIKKWLNYPVQSFVGANYKFDFNLALSQNDYIKKWLPDLEAIFLYCKNRLFSGTATLTLSHPKFRTIPLSALVKP